MSKGPERTIEDAMAKHCARQCIHFLKFAVEGRAGWPDRILLGPGTRVSFAEIKAEGEEPEPLQRWTHDMLRKQGFHVAVVDSVEGAAAAIDRHLGGQWV